ncbi:MAG: FHA domain-containing protein [Fuerstiella sp.]|nr:FHA domain-containing protein [Fuerstiella sp.]
MSPHSSVSRHAASNLNCHSLIPIWSSAAETQSVPRTGRFVCGSSESCDVRIELNGVATNHCLIDSNNDFITVSPASGAGVWLNDAPVNGVERVHSGDRLAIGPATFRFQAAVTDPTVSAALTMQEQQAGSSHSEIAEHIARLERRLEAAETSHLEAVLPLISALTKQSQAQLTPAETSAESTDVPAGSERIDATPDRENGHNRTEGNSQRLHNLELKLHRQSQDLEACGRGLEEQESRLRYEQEQFEDAVAAFEQRLVETTEDAVAEQRAGLDQRSKQLAEQAHELAQRTSELDFRQDELTQQAEQLANAADDVATHAEKLESDRRALLETEREQHRKAESAHVRVADMEKAVSVRETQLAAREATITDAGQNASEYQAKLEVSLERITKLEGELADRDTQLADRQNDIASARQSESQRQTELESSLKRITKLEGDLAAHQSKVDDAIEIDRQQQAGLLKTREAEIDERAAAVQKAARDVEEQAERLRDSEADNVLQRQDVKRQELQLTDRETTLATREAALEERQHKIAIREKDQSERDIASAEESRNAEEGDQARATEQMNAAEAALHTQAEKLAAWEAELEARHVETAARVLQLKRLTKANATSHSPATDPVVPDQKVVAELEDAQQETQRVTAERDELTTTLTELRGAFQSVRDELLAQQESAAEKISYEETDQQQLLTDSNDELHQVQTQLSKSHKDIEELQQYLGEVVSNFDSERAEWHNASSQVTTESGADDAAQAMLCEYEAIISQLKDQLEHARIVAAKSNSDEQTDVSAASAEIAELRRELAEKDEVLLELQMHLGESVETRRDAEQIKLQHAELDDRIAVLDQRDADIRERQRGIENTEQDIEEQQRQLLESRQRLELARAEIQVAVDHQPAMEVPPAEPYEEPSVTDTADTGSIDAADDGEQSSLRSELAEMFGLGSGEPATERGVDVSTPVPIEDYGQEGSEEVSLSFDSPEAVLLESQGDEAVPCEDEQTKADEFVADYMEQLLARNRQKAGGTLPEELVQASSSSSAAAPSENLTAVPAVVTDPEVPGTRSFIDAYMAGDYDSQAAGAVEEVAEVKPSTANETPAAEKTKVDLDALRNDMNSFRALSTQSVENALAVHAKRVEKGGIATRSTIFLVLAIICGIMVLAVLMNVIPLSIVVWLSVAVAIVSGIDLFAKIYLVNRKVKQTAGSLSRPPTSSASLSAVPEQVISPEFLETRRPSAEDRPERPAATVGDFGPDQSDKQSPDVPNAEAPDDAQELDELEEYEEDEYFEL